MDRLDPTLLTPGEKTRFHLLAAEIDRTVATPLDAARHYALAFSEAENETKSEIRLQVRTFLEYLPLAEMAAVSDLLDPVFPKDEFMYRMAAELLEADRYFDAGVQLRALMSEFPDHEKSQWAEDMLLEISGRVDYDRYTIGCLLPLTGPFHSYGSQALKGIELALHLYNADPDHPRVSMDIRDTGGTSEKTFLGVDDLAEARVAAIIGPMIAVEAAAFQGPGTGCPHHYPDPERSRA